VFVMLVGIGASLAALFALRSAAAFRSAHALSSPIGIMQLASGSRHHESVERLLTSDLIAGAITRTQYRAALEELASGTGFAPISGPSIAG
jgi:hypothetical protein